MGGWLRGGGGYCQCCWRGRKNGYTARSKIWQFATSLLPFAISQCERLLRVIHKRWRRTWNRDISLVFAAKQYEQHMKFSRNPIANGIAFAFAHCECGQRSNWKRNILEIFTNILESLLKVNSKLEMQLYTFYSRCICKLCLYFSHPGEAEEERA